MTAEEYQTEATRIRERLVAESRHYLSDGDEAEDVVQDALLRLWDMREGLRSPMQPLARAVVRNLCIDRLRRHPTTTSVEKLGMTDEADDRHEAVERMMSLVDELPVVQQTILRLRHIDGFEMAGIARLMNMTEVAVRKALSRARKAIRMKYWEEYGKEER